MGSPEAEGNLNEHPRHRVHLGAFWISSREVTVAQYERFARETGRALPRQMGHGPQDPVVNVTWWDGDAYCRWAGMRLPTEAQWEKAARGGAVTTYWWGDVATHDLANYTGLGGRDVWDDVSPVGSFPANRYGVHDTAGNVWEWCEDRYGEDFYAASPGRDPVGPAEGDARVLRGGSWDSPADFMRPAYRGFDAPDYSSTLLGFRCALPE
jgi:formylglycine-generating enzyme required for sulfatase activity